MIRSLAALACLWEALRRPGHRRDGVAVDDAERAATLEGRWVDHRRDFWADFREGQRQAARLCLEAGQPACQKP